MWVAAAETNSKRAKAVKLQLLQWYERSLSASVRAAVSDSCWRWEVVEMTSAVEAC